MPPIPIIAVLAVVGLIITVYARGSTTTPAASPDDPATTDNVMGLPDTLPENQSGTYSTKYDSSFFKASQKWGIPFALLKAHSIRESSLRATIKTPEPAGRYSFGLMQLLWWPGSSRFQNYGYSADTIGDGSMLYDPDTNCDIAAQLILENWNRLQNIRDTINAYNTGTTEAKHEAPGNYVDNILGYWASMTGRSSIT